jgi:hypothetical protein
MKLLFEEPLLRGNIAVQPETTKTGVALVADAEI